MLLLLDRDSNNGSDDMIEMMLMAQMFSGQNPFAGMFGGFMGVPNK